MKFTEILEKFKRLGGVAENIELHNDSYGRGILPIDPNKPIKIVVPTHLLASPGWLKLDRDNHIKIDSEQGLDSGFIDFYESYKKFFGWSNVGFNELTYYHNELSVCLKIHSGTCKRCISKLPSAI